MSRPSPRLVFDDPQSAWSFLIQPNDDTFEGQHFDRKEAGRMQGGVPLTQNAVGAVRELVIKTVSAFANSNTEGGLLVLGISSSGDVYKRQCQYRCRFDASAPRESSIPCVGTVRIT